MDNLSVIDRFTETFSQYIDSGFGLLHGEIAYLTATLVVIDMTLAGLFWAMGGQDDIMARLIKKTLYVGAFAFIITNFHQLADIIFRSFAGLGLTATGSGVSIDQFLQPGQLAIVGFKAANPMMQEIGTLGGFPDVFWNLDTIAVLLLAWLVVLVSFFVLAVQLFVALIEFKLTSLAGFVLVPFALWNKSAFLAERVLGNVISSGIKILVLAVIVGIGTGLFGQFQIQAGDHISTSQALSVMLASLALFGLGLFAPGIATGLVSGAPQLGAGAAAGTALAAAGLAVAGGAATVGGARLLGTVGGGGIKAATSLASGARTAYGLGAATSGSSGAGAVAAGLGGVASAAGGVTMQAARGVVSRVGGTLARSARGGARAAWTATGGQPPSGLNPTGAEAPDGPPAWAQRLQRSRRISHGVSTAAHVTRAGDHGGSGANPSLREEE